MPYVFQAADEEDYDDDSGSEIYCVSLISNQNDTETVITVSNEDQLGDQQLGRKL